MNDKHERYIDYLRVSVTDRCNFRCRYCMPPEGLKMLKHSHILSYEELYRVLELVSSNGLIHKVRITGGEPLVRKGILGFIRQVAALPGITDVSLTTNGALLAKMAKDLKAAGLKRVNISLDTADAERFRYITGGGRIFDTLQGIEAALAAGLQPVKINAVLTELLAKEDVVYFVDLVRRQPISVRFIEYMPIGSCRLAAGMSVAEVQGLVNELSGGDLQPETAVYGAGPARCYRLPQGAKGSIGFITPISEHFCERCNRLRLTADGRLKPCLLSNTEFDLKALLRSGAPDEQLLAFFRQAIIAKPAGHELQKQTKPEFNRRMSQIGG